MSVAERLRWAVEQHRSLSIRKFQAAMKQEGIDGSSYATVHSYLRGETEPSLEFLKTAASILGVGEPWLVLGEGQPTAVERLLADHETVEHEGQEVRIPSWPSLLDLPELVRSEFRRTLTLLYDSAPDTPDPDSDAGEAALGKLALDVQFLLLAPLRSWGFQRTAQRIGRLKSREVEEYAVAMLHALRLAIPTAGNGDPLSAHAESLLPALVERALPEFELLEDEN